MGHLNLNDDDMRRLEEELLKNPKIGAVIKGNLQKLQRHIFMGVLKR